MPELRNIDELCSTAILEFPYRMEHLLKVCGGAPKLARAMGITPTKLYEWTYRGAQGQIRMPSGASAMRLALATGADINWLFTGKGQSPSATNIALLGERL